MDLSKIYLSNFRNFEKKLIEFSDEVTVIVGPNAAGKTNILESVNLLATGKSFRAKLEEEMINYDEEVGRVKGLFVDQEDEETKLEVILTRGEITVGESPKKTEKVARKRIKINGVGKRLIDFAGTFKTVLFGPWDLDLVLESPSDRRKFLDNVLSQVDREYRRATLSYNKALRQRNKLLYKIREEGLSRSKLLFWDKLLLKNGDYISRRREKFIDFINQTELPGGHSFSLEYDKSAISENRLAQYAKEEISAATTLVGPHRDDMIFKIAKRESDDKRERDLAKYGSRGEQRMGVLWLKLGEVLFIEKETEEKPTLLLDDIFSELDHDHREIAIEASKKQQTIITTADPHFVENLEKVEKIELTL